MRPHRRAWLQASLASASAMALAGFNTSALAEPFDHRHTAWSALLSKHVLPQRGGQASSLRYAGMAADRAALRAVLDGFSAVDNASFQAFNRAQQMAFLINAYNAFTVELILTRYLFLASIKDLGGVFSNPWKPKGITLLGSKVSLDDIEHGMLRQRGRYDDPRLHFAVNCASIGCPPLREEAFVGDRLDAQLDEQALRFMSDRSRNRFDAERGRLDVSKIFDWYGEDFRLGHQGIRSLPNFMARYAQVLTDAPADRERIRREQVEIGFGDYDWKLNDAR